MTLKMVQMSKKDFSSDSEMRHLMRTIDNGIILAQKRLVARAKREGFSLIACPDGRKVIEVNPETIVF